METAKNFMSELRAVYRWLEDDISRDIYLQRFNYLLTDDKSYIDNIVRKYLPQLKIYGESERFCQYINSQSDVSVILYGAGRDASFLASQLKKLNGNILFCDRNTDKQINGFFGYKVISPEKLHSSYRKACVIITTSKYVHEIRDDLIKHGFDKDQIVDMHNLLAMYVPGFYFDMPFLHYGEHEVFVDAGSYNLGTTRLLLKYCDHLDKVYAFEPSEDNFQLCERCKSENKMDFVNLYNYGTWSRNDVLQFDATMDTGSRVAANGEAKIRVVAIDDIVGEDKVTFIKMDVEGSELESLRGAKKTILNHKPKLAISIYHKLEDMVTIPSYIHSIVPYYKFYVRHLSNLWTETVLYAV